MKATIEIKSKRDTHDPQFQNCNVKLSMPEPYLIILEWVGEAMNPTETGQLLFTAEEIFEAIDVLRKASGYDETKRKEEMKWWHYTGDK